MISMQGVPSSLVLRNASWVRQEAQSLMRRMPANVEKADLIQVGLIAVAQAAGAFTWESNGESDQATEATEAFVRLARMRVKDAMLDELRQMDHLGRAERRKVKVIQLATERWVARHGTQPAAAELARVCSLPVQEVFDLELAANAAQSSILSDDPEPGDPAPREAASAQDEVGARVDTGMLLRRLEPVFAALLAREREAIDTFLGIGVAPVELTESLPIRQSRGGQWFKSVCSKFGIPLGHGNQRAIDRARIASAPPFDELIAEREAELARFPPEQGWGELLQEALAQSLQPAGGGENTERLSIGSTARWG